jgi:hypothetical protein
MPAGYEKIRDTLLTRGLSRKAAQSKAAKIWNAKHPNNPVGRHNSKKTILTS